MRRALLVFVALASCSRNDPGDPYPLLPAAVVTSVEVVDAPAYAGQVGVRAVVQVENRGESAFAVVDASLDAGDDLVTFESFRADFAEVAPGSVARLRFFGRVGMLDTAVSLPLEPQVLVTTAGTAGTFRAEITATPAQVSVEPLGPALVVTAAADDLDGPSTMTTVDEAGATLSLREAITLVNNGHPLTRIAFDPSVFPPGAPTNIVIGGGNVGQVPLPPIARGGVFLDGLGAGVRIARAQGLPQGANQVRVESSGATIRALEFQTIVYFTGADVTLERTRFSNGQPVFLTSAHRFAANDCDFVESVPVSVSNSDDVAVTGSRLNGPWDINNSPGLVWERNAMSSGVVAIRTSPFAQVRDASFALPPSDQTMLALRDSPSSTIERCSFAAGASSLPAIQLVASPNTRVLAIDSIGFSHAAVSSDAATTGSLAVPVVSEIRDGVVSGTAQDGGLINLYEVGLRLRVYAGMTVAANGVWTIDTGSTSLERVVATASPPGGGTSADSEIFSIPLPSCEGGRVLWRTSFEPNELVGVTLTNLSAAQDFTAPDGTWTLLSAATPPFAAIDPKPIDFSTAVTPYARLFTFRPSQNPSVLPTLFFEDSGMDVKVADMQFEAAWFQRTVDLAGLAGYGAPVTVRIEVPASTFIDLLEICDGPH